MNTFKNRSEDTMRQTTHKLLSTAAAICLVFGTSTSIFAQSEFAGSLNTVSISDAAGTNKPPTASFTYTQDGDTFTFDAGGSFDSDGSIVEYTWDFGNTTSALGMIVSHVFSVVSDRNVTLTLIDDNNAVSMKMVQIQPSLSISDLIPTNYATGKIAVGQKFYYTHDFVIKSVPDNFIGNTIILTNAADKYNVESGYIFFSVNKPTTLYVAYQELTNYPTWLTSSYKKTTDVIETTFVRFSVWEKNISGDVTIPGNGYQTKQYTWANYFLFFAE